jgi:hypothetical protein
MTLSKISISTWNTIFARVRQIYTTMIRSTIIYEFVVWHTLKKIKNVKTLINKFIIMQNKYLRTIAEAFKVILILMLEAKIYISFIDAHLDQLQTSTKIRLKFERLQKLIANSCRTIVNKLRDRAERRRDRNSISSEKKHSWMKQIFQNQTLFKQSTLIFFWIDSQSINHARKEVFNTITRTCQFAIRTKVTRVWFDSWATHLQKLTRSSMIQTSLINRQRLKMHQSLRKIESFLITQIRSKKIDLTSFFFRKWVLDVFSSICFCNWH